MAEKIGYLDGLRGLAAFIVVIFHYLSGFYPALFCTGAALFSTGYESLIYATPLNVFLNGQFSVCIFFVLSGYVLTYKFYASGDQSVLNSGAIRRYFRLVPVVIFSIMCYLIVLSLVQHFSGNSDLLAGPQFIVHNQTINIPEAIRQGLIGDFVDDHAGGDLSTLYNVVLWTMGIEFIGSMIVFSFASLFGRSRNRWVFYLAGLCLFASTFYLAFILGALLADVINSKKRAGDEFVTKRITNGLLTLSLMLGGLFLVSNNGHLFYQWIFSDIPLFSSVPAVYFDHYSIALFGIRASPMVLGAGMIIAAILGSPGLKKILSARVFLFLGKISFSLYVMHVLVMGVFSNVTFNLMFVNLHLPYAAALVGTLLLSLVPIISIAYLTYRLIDEPGTRLSRKIYEKFFNGESRLYEWALVKKRVVKFERAYFYPVILAEILIIITVMGAFVYIQPILEHGHATQAEQWYRESLNNTSISYKLLSDYTQTLPNNASLGAYRVWVDGYKSRLNYLASDFRELNASSSYYMSFLNEHDQIAITINISHYRILLDDSYNKNSEYEAVYDLWYWNNTPVSKND